MAFQQTNLIEVKAWGQTVGALAASRRTRAYVFEYDRAWVAAGREISPLNMSSGNRPFTFPGLSEETWHLLPPAIADALPDKFGSSIIDAELASRGASMGQVTALDRLAYTGQRAMGALEFVPESGPTMTPPTLLDIGELVRVARDVVAGKLGSDRESGAALQQILAIGTSAGGARAKAVVNINDETGDIGPGQTPAEGTSAWLLKFDGVGADKQLGSSNNYGRIEHAYALMAKAAGIRMSDTRLLEENGRAHFMTRRFDRPGGTERIHMQTLCAMSVLDFNTRGVHDYAQLQSTIDALGLDQDAKQEAFRRQIFNYAAANCDDHTKNHSFLMGEDGVWSLSPAYDVTHAYDPDNQWLHRHLMGVNGKFEDVTRAEHMRFAERHGVLNAARIIKVVNEAIASWSEFAAAAGIPSKAAGEVAADLKVVR